jgi:signal transduction histidine kinase/CheY-like chemotaxis protein/HPt (histidine-containing phosphotransfer) domain-containing protein
MKRNWKNLVFILSITFVLMALMVVFTSRVIYKLSNSYITEIGNDKTAAITADLENYLETAKSAIYVVADSVDHMVAKGATNEEIVEYITRESENTTSYFDSTYTGIYGVIGGGYVDGVGWVPPEDYDPTARDWYKTLVNGNGAVTIVSPYVDAQTGAVIISVGKSLSDKNNALALDLTLNSVQEIAENININGYGYGYIQNYDGMVIAHKHVEEIGKNYAEDENEKALFDKVIETGKGNFDMEIDGEECIVFVDEVMDQWHLVIITAKSDLFSSQRQTIFLCILVSTIVFALISTFYIVGYKNERKANLRMEEMKVNEQRKDYEAKVLKLEKSAADEANKAKSNFLADMSHEIRTPINAVLGMNEMILRKSKDEEILDYSANIKSAGNTLLSIINSILDFSKIEDGKMELIPVEFDVNDLTHSLVNSISERAKAKNLEFKVEVDEKMPSKLYGDDVRISQVIMNLLTNAVKYTEQGAVTLSIRKKELRGENLIFQVSVKDTGIGIRKEDIDKLSHSFERLEEKRNRHIEGTGLGISIVTRLLGMMNSKLRVESEYGKGSVFSFELMLKIADSTPVGKYQDRRNAGARAADEANKLMAFNAKVLITDDNEMNLKVASNFMKLFGINAETCTSGEETIELMRKNKYDILFLDHMMPKMDGIETLEILKRENLVPAETVVIALTANAVVGAKEQYLSVGFNDYLSKPIELKDLEKMLRKYLPQDMWKMEGNKEIGEISNNEINTDDKMSSFVKLGLNTEEGMAYCGGEEDFYIEIIGDYSKACEANIAKLENFKSQGDFENYKVLIHSVKSASKTIGSKELFNEAFELEKASGRGDKEFVEKKHDAFMKKYKKLADELTKVIQP